MTAKRQRLKRTFTAEQLVATEFKVLEFDGPWLAHVGRPAQRLRMIVHGPSANGKTRYLLDFAAYLTTFGKVYYNSFEEGKSETLKKAVIESQILDRVPKGRLVFGDQDDFDTMLRRMTRRNSPRFLFIDSLDYMDFSVDQYKVLHDALPEKGIILVSWSEGKAPKTAAAKAIYYMVDLKCRVAEFKAYLRSRYGGIEPYVIWPEYWERKAAAAKEKAATLGVPVPPAPATPPRLPPITSPPPPDEPSELEDEEALLDSLRYEG
jgi:hypothetical protein